MKDEAQAALRSAAREWPVGLYKHYKNSDYIVYSHSVDEPTLEPLVHYYSLGRGTRWTRRISNFAESVAVGGAEVPRFRYVAPCTVEQLARAAGIAT